MFSFLIISQLKSIFSMFFILLSSILIMVIFLFIRKKLKEATQELMRNVNIRDTISDKIMNNSKEIVFNAGEEFILHKSLNLNLPVANSYLKLGFYQIIPADIIRYISIIIFTIITFYLSHHPSTLFLHAHIRRTDAPRHKFQIPLAQYLSNLGCVESRRSDNYQ